MPDRFANNAVLPAQVRQREVQVSASAIGEAAAGGRVLEIAFFDDAVYKVLVRSSQPTLSGGTAYLGEVLGSPHPVVIVDNGAALSVFLVADNARYSLKGTPEGGFTAREMVEYDPPEHPAGEAQPTGPNIVRRPGIVTRSDPVLQPPPIAQADDGTKLDIMVVYTPAALAAVGGSVTQMNADIDAQVAYMDSASTGASVLLRPRLVYRGMVTYTESSMAIDLNRITDPADGFMDEVKVLRDLYKADVVSLFGVYDVAACGTSTTMQSELAAFESQAYSVVAAPRCTGAGQYSLAHEIGHNLGLWHDNFIDGVLHSLTIVTPTGSSTPTQIAYAHGYVDLANRFRTLMAENAQCRAQASPPGGYDCLRIPRWANPSQNFNNAAYWASATIAPLGNATNANEAQVITHTRDTTSNFRSPQLTPAQLAGAGVIIFLPASYTVAEASGSVEVKVARHVGSAGAVSVAYTTASGTATSGADFTATSGTFDWAAGDMSVKSIIVPIAQDAVVDGDEAFTVVLSSPTGGVGIGTLGGTTSSATVTIVDDEPDNFPVTALLPGGFTSPETGPFTNTPTTVWATDATRGAHSYSSVRSARVLAPNANFDTFYNSDLVYTGVFRAGDVGFFYRLSSYDDLAFHEVYSGYEFSIDGVVVSSSPGGEIDWTSVSVPITAGTHTLRWRYKNMLNFRCNIASPLPTGGANCADRLWVDQVTLPLARHMDFSGEGRTDIVMQHTDGTQTLWLMNGTTPVDVPATVIGAGTGWTITAVGDLDGDGKSDLVWRHTDGRIALYLMNGATATSTQQILNAGGWTVTHMPDVNGDGKADLLFQHADGTVAVWTMNGTAMTAGASIIGAGTGWSVILTGDFDGDGKDDLLWKHTDGRHAIWLMNGTAIKATQQILNAGDWTATHLADLNGDGRMDIVWQHTDGTIATWLIEGSFMSSGAGLLGPGTGWSVALTGDFDGDSKADLLFQHTDGRAAIYLMNGSVPTATQQILNAGDWIARRVADTNGDGKADILFQNTNGATALWLMDGTLMTSGADLLPAGSGYSIGTMSP
jgi:uncharacterized protein (DUF2141 family)